MPLFLTVSADIITKFDQENKITMQLQAVDSVENISAEEFKKNYYYPMKPLVIKNLSKDWPAYKKWTWDYFIDEVGEKEVGVYNNVKSDAYTPINTADAYMKFGSLSMIGHLVTDKGMNTLQGDALAKKGLKIHIA